MKRSKRALLTIAALLCAGLTVLLGAKIAPVHAEEATDPVLAEQTYKIGDLPYHTGYSEFGYYDAGNVEYVLKAGRFNAAAENYGLTPFDYWSGSNKITTTLYPNMSIENWKWSFADGGTCVIEVKSKIDGKITFDLAGATGGWMDSWNTIFSVHRKNVDGSLDTFLSYFQGKDSISGATTPSNASGLAAILNQEVKVAVGDIVYYELGSLTGRNMQSMTERKIIATPISDDPVVNKITELNPVWASEYEALNKAHYTEEGWASIESIYASFAREAKDCASAEEVQALYDAKLAALKAVEVDPVLVVKDEKSSAISAAYASKKQSDFTEENWLIYKGAYDEFVAGLSSCATVEAVNELYDAKLAVMASVKAFKQSHNYLDYPSKMNANGFDWIKGDVFDTKLYAGTVADMKEFDSKGSSNNIIYNAELNAGLDNPAYYAENWKWFVGRDAGVIIAFKANQDSVITIENTRIASGSGQGWTSDCKLSYYIEREGVVKHIFEVNAPSADEQFSGDWHLRAGDVLYIEFVSFIINAGEVRNTEAPCHSIATGDATKFDAEIYAEQNHDLPAEVVEAIAAKTALLQELVAGLKEEDYSATNWLAVGDLVAQFIEKCDKEVETIADVEALYEKTVADIQAVPNKQQAEAELKAALDGYVAELQAEYDKLVAENSYSDENKALLDKALSDGKLAIGEAKSKSAGNTAKLNAVAALRAVEASAPVEEGGSCSSSIGAVSGVITVLGMAFGVIAARRKREER